MNGSRTQQKPMRPYQKSGVFGLKKALKRRGLKALDGRSSLARSVKLWRTDVAADRGGDLSRAEETLLDMAAAAVVLLGQNDAWIGANPEQIVNRRRRCVAPIVKERIAVANHLKDLLTTLGLKRRTKEIPSLSEYLASRTPASSKPLEGRSTAHRPANAESAAPGDKEAAGR